MATEDKDSARLRTKEAWLYDESESDLSREAIESMDCLGLASLLPTLGNVTEADRRVCDPALVRRSAWGNLRASDGLDMETGVVEPLNESSEGNTSEFGREETVEEKTELEVDLVRSTVVRIRRRVRAEGASSSSL